MSQSRTASVPVELAGGGRLSLFDAISERNRALNKKSLVHRLVYVGRLSETLLDKRDLGGYCEKLCKHCQQQFSGEGASGILLIYSSYYVHLVESSGEILHAIVDDLESSESKKRGLTKQSKILNLASDIPVRLFGQWSYRVLTLPQSTRPDEYDPTESLDQVVGQCLRQLLQVGNYLNKIPKSEFRSAMDSLPERVPDLIIPPDILEYLIQSSKLCSPTRYKYVYRNPCKVVLDNELVWPLPVRLFPYTI
ncbi:testis-expressed protein 47-like [Corticium candelabrum]|uniref:testis-expressed protein 47-like n=1 Tax=Corticium candelabrum TaxID=121492 RepID=UPI002E37AF07|nr:testis-expressed protein 47-like [Corticium candelabrum]